MAFPVVGSRNSSVEAANTGTHTVALPASISTGDLLIAVITMDGNNVITFTGWTEFGDASQTTPTHKAYWRKATGTDPNTFTIPNPVQQSTHRTWRFTSASVTDPDTISPQAGGATGSGTDPNPPSFDPTWTSGDDTTWIATCGRDDDDSTSQTYPANYTDTLYHQSNSTAGSCEAAYGERDLSTSGAEDPGVFDLGNTAEQWGALTIAIPPSGAAPPSTDIIQASFRWRATDPTGINANGGGDWAAAKDVDITGAIQDINPASGRVRIGLRNSSGGTIATTYEVWYSKDGGGYQIVPAVTTPWAAATQQREVALVPSSSFTNGAATTEILADAGTFVAGEGRETNPTGSISLATGEDTEIEFKLLFRKWSGDGHVPDATTFDFQIRDATAGLILGTYTETPRLTIGNQPGHIGGASIEAPGNTMVADDDGNLYVAIEATDATGGTFENELVVMKSADGGDSWTPPDIANRPGTGFTDIEAADMHYVAADDRIYIAFQGPNTDLVYYVEFNTAGHASPDEYGTVETVDSGVPGASINQVVGIIRRASDGVTKVTYADHDGTDQRLSLKSRTSGGTWDTSPTSVDTQAAPILSVGGAWMVIDSSNVIHMLYAVLPGGASDGELYHREISTGDTLSGRTQVNDVGTSLDGDSASHQQPHVPPVLYSDSGTETIAVVFVDVGDDMFFTQSPVSTIAFITDEAVSGADVAMALGTSNSATAALAVDDVDDDFVAVWTDEVDTTLMRKDVRVSGSWGTDTTELDSADIVGWERAITFTHSSPNGGDRVVGILYDVHPVPGGTGGVKYREIVRAVGGAVYPPFPRGQGTVRRNTLVRM